MAAYINRNVVHNNPMNGSRKISGDEKSSSPLQVFVQAKKQINFVFGSIQSYVTDASERMTGKIIIYFS